jgi:hypothetical protein
VFMKVSWTDARVRLFPEIEKKALRGDARP